MPDRELTDSAIAWRIGDPQGRWPIYSAEGSIRCDGRWHNKGDAVIYASEHYGTAMLEKLVHYNGVLPPNQHYIKITIPSGTTYEVVSKDSLPGWDNRNQNVSQQYGSRWFNEKRSVLLIVPSVVSREENNYLINTLHSDAAKIKLGLETPVRWDKRLFTS